MFLGSAGLRPHFFLLEDRRKESAHTKSRPQKKEHTLLRPHFCHVSKTASLVALISKTASLVGLILVGAHNEEQNRGYTIDEEVRHP